MGDGVPFGPDDIDEGAPIEARPIVEQTSETKTRASTKKAPATPAVVQAPRNVKPARPQPVTQAHSGPIPKAIVVLAPRILDLAYGNTVTLREGQHVTDPQLIDLALKIGVPHRAA